MTATSIHSVSVPGLETDEEGARIVHEELKLLSTVLEAVASAQRSEETQAEAKRADDAALLELRESVAVAKPEDLPALFEQMHHLAALREQRGKSRVGSLDPKTPYFGHLRVMEDGKRRDVLVGSRAYIDPRSAIRVVDWRHAPVSRIFYRYQEGDDYEEELGGRQVEGKVLARRSVTIESGELVRVASPRGTFVRGPSGAWRRVGAHVARLVTEGKPKSLGVGAGEVARDKHLPAIASMLDAAQFELISKPGAGLVCVQGSAGSGKTTVGLHRAAYLAFADPVRYRADRILVVVPNEALRHYVGHVLPTLGVGEVKVTTFARLAAEILPVIFPKIPTRVSDETPPVVARAKSHPRVLRAMNDAQARVLKAMDDKVTSIMGKWPEGERVIDAWRHTREIGAPDARVLWLSQWTAGKRKLGAHEASRLPEVTRGALEKLVHDLHQGARVVLSTWDELFTSRKRLDETFAGEADFGPGRLDQVHEWCVRQARIRQEGERDGEVASIDAEDRPILLRLYQLLRGPLPDAHGKPIVYHHTFVDEVQDSSPVELRVLLGMSSKDLSVTLAGDIAQRMGEEDREHVPFDWDKLLTELDVPHIKVEPLKVSYRSTAEITEFARNVLGPYKHEAEPIAKRHGPPVELFTFASQGEAALFLADALKQLARAEPYANVAIVARFPQQADVYYEGLSRADVPNIRRVARLDFSWEPGFDVTDVRSTKGLEFDEVVLVDVNASSYPDSAQGRHALYVGATRAAHQLWCVASEQPSSVAEQALPRAANP